uniref:FBD domain-containing protein n=1 Tax=Panagrellus redivivus TaxID=6233 RepID=A0A7E4UTU8_PANRE
MEPVALNCEMVRSLFYMMARRSKFRKAILSFAISHKTALYTASYYACKNVFFLFQNGRLILNSREYAIYKNNPFTSIFKRFVKKAAIFFDQRMDLDYVLRILKDMDNLCELSVFSNNPTAFWKIVETNNKFFILFLNVELLKKLQKVSSNNLPNVLSLRLIGTPVEGCVKLTHETFPCLRHLAFCREKMSDKGYRQYVAMNQVVSPGMTAALVLRMFETGEAPERQIEPMDGSWQWDSTFVTVIVIVLACSITFCYQFFWVFYDVGVVCATLIVGPEL